MSFISTHVVSGWGKWKIKGKGKDKMSEENIYIYIYTHTIYKLLLTTHDLLTRVDCKEQVDVAVLDFSKAFDYVPRLRLLWKLELLSLFHVPNGFAY